MNGTRKERLRKAGQLLSYIFSVLQEKSVVGTSLLEVDTLAGELLHQYGAKSSTMLEGFPHNLSISINNQVIGGIPNSYILQEGDLVSFDMGLYYKGYYVDKATSFGIPPVHFIPNYLIHSGKLCLNNLLKVLRAGIPVSYIGDVISQTAKVQKLVVGREFYGHGTGYAAHTLPAIPNYKNKDTITVKAGDILAVEPILFYDRYILKYPTQYTVESNVLSVHFEDTYLIEEDGAEVIT